ncbi:hypothetical protein E2R51_16595 [Jeotgalibacillus sp. S-D1]|uniref:HAAS signaling domain-containing protein n=1 Tax=Jeotgalibacillus sp. S-D1 TaxID=2552189 RepID=UPI00105A13A4|nr:hypothetical protein [Jeotgalibacillus sp. S-D1]TDL30941.1 hypothetical protein E2R51_16595 [Jeotgalibacillus sp. S-D1]
MNLIDLYVHEVTRLLPEKNREDIALELQSTIQDMLPDNPTEDEIKAALSKLGDPAKLAGQYRDIPRYLIGPALYDHYLTILKMTFPIVLAVVLITQVLTNIINYAGEATIIEMILALSFSIVGAAFNVGVQTLFWITLVFFVLERSGAVKESFPQSTIGAPWKPEDLKYLSSIPKKKAISKSQVLFSLIWTAVWAGVYFNAVNIIAVYERDSTSGFNYVTPIFNEETLLSFWPFVCLLIAIEIALAIFKWVLGQWTPRLAVINAFYNAVYILVFIFLASSSNLFNPSFVDYQVQLFNSTADDVMNVVNGAVWTSIVIAIIISVLDSYEGFKKARISLTKLFNK